MVSIKYKRRYASSSERKSAIDKLIDLGAKVSDGAQQVFDRANQYGKLKTIFCPIEKLLLSIKREPHIFVFHHVFDIHVNALD